MSTRFSVVIPAHRDGPAFRRCLEECLAQAYGDMEVLVVSDSPVEGLPKDVKHVQTGSPTDTSPAEKRDYALPQAAGDVIAYIDDDAYPAPDWLKSAARYFADASLHVLGGPGVTPPGSPWRERAGGSVYESPAGSAMLRYRFLPGSPRTVDDYPAYNFFVRREALEHVGGWGTTFYGGEDTVLCLKLAEAGYRVHYVPDVVVFHYRRPVVKPHLLQIANVGRHRGYFTRVFPETSRRALYALPALTPAVLVLATVACWRRPALGIPLAAAGYGLVAAESLRRHPVSVALATPVLAVAHHLAYGTSFMRGLLSKEMKR
jgi:GT2 family glycosyltransferase